LTAQNRPGPRLDRACKLVWRSYRQAFRQCQRKQSRANVHQLRVETRRLLALVDLFEPILGGGAAERIRRDFKSPFKLSGRLRDTQVMLCDVKRLLGRFPEAKQFGKELLRREKRLSRQLERELRRIRLKALKSRMGALREQLRAVALPAAGNLIPVRLLKGVGAAFANAVARCRGVALTKPRAVHRTRIAFKKFRYMVEQLRPLMLQLGGVSRERMRAYQALMGDIQDCEMLLAALEDFMREEKAKAGSLRKFRAAIKLNRTRFMARYLPRADELYSFWNRSFEIHSRATAHKGPLAL